MQFDEGAAEAKRNELREAVAAVESVAATLTADVREKILSAFARITPPTKPEVAMDLITISSLYSTPKAESRKPGNVVLNGRRLVDIVPDISLAGLGASTLPVAPAIAAVLAALYVWNKLWRGSLEEFSDADAVTILALWQGRDSRNKIGEQDGFEKANELSASYSLPPLSQGQYAAAIDRLIRIKCIELESGVIWLREWVRIKYT